MAGAYCRSLMLVNPLAPAWDSVSGMNTRQIRLIVTLAPHEASKKLSQNPAPGSPEGLTPGKGSGGCAPRSQDLRAGGGRVAFAYFETVSKAKLVPRARYPPWGPTSPLHRLCLSQAPEATANVLQHHLGTAPAARPRRPNGTPASRKVFDFDYQCN